jgi:hypothetical protein
MNFWGPMGGMSFTRPSYERFVADTQFTNVAGVNPLDDHQPHSFQRIIGLQYLLFKNLTAGTYWKIALEGGFNRLNNGYIGAFDRQANYSLGGNPLPVNCTVVQLPPVNTLTHIVQFMVTDTSNNFQYLLTYSPYVGVQPTIELQAPSTLGAQNIVVETQYYKFFSS